jgi:hypothetical protein
MWRAESSVRVGFAAGQIAEAFLSETGSFLDYDAPHGAAILLSR